MKRLRPMKAFETNIEIIPVCVFGFKCSNKTSTGVNRNGTG